jgi:hypothetical protein
MRSRTLSAVVLAGLLAFVLLAALGASAYPGGTYCEPDADAYRFWDNYFCDLTSAVTRWGEDNARGAALTHTAFTAFAVALAPFWWLVGALSSPRAGAVVRWLGVPSACAVAALAWLPSTASPRLHTTMVLVAAVPGLAAATLGAVALFLGPHRALGWLGVGTLILGALNTGGYAWAVAHSVACLPWLPVVQKLTGVGLVAWMAGVALSSQRKEAA